MKKEAHWKRRGLGIILCSLIILTINSVNSKAQTTVSAGNGTNNYLLATTATIVDPALVVSSASSITGFRVTISTGLQSADVLSYTGTLPSGVTVTAYNSTTGVLAFSGSASASDWETFLRTVTYYNSNSMQCGNRTITFSAGSNSAFTNGHFYELVSPAATWTAAKANAASRTFMGYTGYLATITSDAENTYIKQVLNADAWVGCSDSYTEINTATGTTTYANQSAAEGKWYWVTGPEKGTMFSVGNGSPVTQSGQYANWNSGEPNNSGTEHYGEIYSSGGSAGRWNDLPNTSLVYVVEYGGLPSDPAVDLSANITIQTLIASNTTSASATVCYGGSPSAITGSTPTGGIGTYTYSWLSSTSSTSGFALASGTNNTKNYSPSSLTQTTYFKRVVTSGALNDTTAVVSIIINPQITSTSSQVNVACNGGATGSATVVASGGTSPYSYAWSGGGTAATKSTLSAGNYTVTITDANSCTATASYTITQPAAISSSSSQTNVSCNSGSNGTATVIASGGSSPYTYSWSGGGTSATKSSLSAGSYTVTITDANSCTASRTFTITQPTAISASSSQINVLCNGGGNGSATVVASGGTSPYTYAWSGGGTAATKSSLTAGSYTVTITDANSCTSSSSFTITQPTALSSVSSQVNVLCNGGSTGSATVVASGGTSPYAYAWSGGGTSATKSSLATGNYTVTITDANSCTSSASFTITQPTAITSTSSQVNVACNGGATGSATVVASGGTSPYSYAWSGGGTAATKSTLSAGNYTVTITDANSCTATASYTITQPAAISSSSSQTNVSCNSGSNGTATVIASGGSSPYTYSWSSGGNSATETGLSEGSYSYTITDINNCTSSATVVITEPSMLIASESHVNNPCYGNTVAAAEVNITGGTSPFTYLWNTGETTSTISGLGTGSFSCTVTDANGCTSISSLLITEPDSLSSVIIYNDVICFGDTNGQAEITVTGGTSPYSYLWSDGETSDQNSNLSPQTYTVEVTDAAGCNLTRSVTINEPVALQVGYISTDNLCHNDNAGTILTSVNGGIAPYSYFWSNGNNTSSDSNLSAGNYAIEVTDANGCVEDIIVTINEPMPLAISLTSIDVDCHGAANGSITANVNGGTSPYEYLWDNGDTNQIASNLHPQVYSVLITDVNGCTIEESLSVEEPDILAPIYSSIDVTCYNESNGSATVFVSGGIAPYAYTWPSGSVSSSDSNLTAGVYLVNVTDSNGCLAAINVTVNEPLQLTSTTTITDVFCYGLSTGTASISISGGVLPYSYSWSTSETTSSVSNLAVGVYGVTVTDGNGCIYIDSVVITQPDSIMISYNSTNLACNNEANGSASVSVVGGVLPFTYLWSNGDLTSSAVNLSASDYTVTITDANGCESALMITITEPDALVLTTATISSTCGNADGEATVNASGGTGSYSYLWSNGGTTVSINNLLAGFYSVTVTDDNGCSTSDNVAVSDINAPSVTFIQSDVTCFNAANGIIDLTISGGTGSSSCLWNNGSTGTSLSSLSPGSYSYLITDSIGCNSAGTIVINEPAELEIVAQVTHEENGQPGSIDATVNGGIAPYVYSWSNGGSGSAISGLSAGNYLLTVTDANGCSAVDSFTVNLITGIEENTSNILMVYPNPNAGSFMVKSDVALELVLCNSVGELVGNYSTEALNNYTINIENLSTGIYFLRSFSETQQGIIRIVVLK